MGNGGGGGRRWWSIFSKGDRAGWSLFTLLTELPFGVLATGMIAGDGLGPLDNRPADCEEVSPGQTFGAVRCLVQSLHAKTKPFVLVRELVPSLEKNIHEKRTRS